MAFTYNGTEPTDIIYNNTSINLLKYNDTYVWVRAFTLSIDVQNSSYLSSYSVTRTSSPYANASLGLLLNGATIYYGDVLSTTATAKATEYGSWERPLSSHQKPSITITGALQITITNNNNYTCACYYGAGRASSEVRSNYLADVGSSSSANLTVNPNSSTTPFWNAEFRYTDVRNVYTYGYSTNGNTTVSGNTTIVIQGTITTSTESVTRTGSYTYCGWTQVWSGSSGGNFTISSANFNWPTSDIPTYKNQLYAYGNCTHKSSTNSFAGSPTSTFSDGYTVSNVYNNKNFYFNYNSTSTWKGYTNATSLTRTGYLTNLYRWKVLN